MVNTALFLNFYVGNYGTLHVHILTWIVGTCLCHNPNLVIFQHKFFPSHSVVNLYLASIDVFSSMTCYFTECLMPTLLTIRVKFMGLLSCFYRSGVFFFKDSVGSS